MAHAIMEGHLEVVKFLYSIDGVFINNVFEMTNEK